MATTAPGVGMKHGISQRPYPQWDAAFSYAWPAKTHLVQVWKIRLEAHLFQRRASAIAAKALALNGSVKQLPATGWDENFAITSWAAGFICRN